MDVYTDGTRSIASASTPAVAPTVRTGAGIVRGVNRGRCFQFQGDSFCRYDCRPQPLAPSPTLARVAGRTRCEQVRRGLRAGGIRSGRPVDVDVAELIGRLPVYQFVAPLGASSAPKLPVMVWIFGGGFVFGSGTQPSNSGVQFAKQGVILVTFNYRAGRFGFFAFPALSQEHPDEPKGNYVYMDQTAALKWVQQNIAAFGGDPKSR